MNLPVSHCLRCGKWFKEDGDALCPKCQPSRTSKVVSTVVLSESVRKKLGLSSDFRF